MLDEFFSDTMKETITETLNDLGEKLSTAVITLLVGIILTKGADAAHNWLKNKHNIDIDKSVFEDALKSANRKA